MSDDIPLETNKIYSRLNSKTNIWFAKIEGEFVVRSSQTDLGLTQNRFVQYPTKNHLPPRFQLTKSCLAKVDLRFRDDSLRKTRERYRDRNRHTDTVKDGHS